MSREANIVISSFPPKYIEQYVISPYFKLPVNALESRCIIPIVGKYDGYTIETTLKNGKMNGKTIVNNEDGVIMEELYLVDGSREGECLTRGRDSKLNFRGMYKDDKRNGIGFTYKDGQEDSVIRYVMDIAQIVYKKRNDMDSYWEERDPSNNHLIAVTQLNENFERKGRCYLFNESGSILSVNKYSNGVCRIYKSFENGIMMIYDENNNRVYIGGYLNSIKEEYPCNGKGKCYDENIGKLVYEGDFVKGKWEGRGKYYINGKLKYEGEMKNGFASGEGKYYNKDGVVEVSGVWEYGYLKMGNNRWLNFETGEYEKGEELCRLKDVKKRGGEYKSGMDVFWEQLHDFFTDKQNVVTLLFIINIINCWVIYFYSSDGLLQSLSSIMGTLYVMGAIVFAIYSQSNRLLDWGGYGIIAALLLQIVCCICCFVELVKCARRHEAITMWLMYCIAFGAPLFGMFKYC